MRRYNTLYLSALIIGQLLFGCKKQDDFLNTKRNLNDVRPSTIQDAQAILDDNYDMNVQYPSSGLAGCDNYYISDLRFSSLGSIYQNAYLWKKDGLYNVGPNSEWATQYQRIEFANIALDVLAGISPDASNQQQYNNAKGCGLFFRAFSFYMAAQAYCNAYDKSTASKDLGIVLRLTSDVNVQSTRATVQQTYDQMINDLKEAVAILPAKAGFPMRPSAPTANALLAKIYLSMEDYENAAKYATAALSQFNTLVDYNSNLVSYSGTYAFPSYPNNPEVNFYAISSYTGSFLINWASRGIVDSTLYNSYEPNDLRKTLFFTKRSSDGQIAFRGNYVGSFSGGYYPFCGIAGDELYLIRAESYARTNNIQDALADLNALLVNRYKAGTFVPIAISDPLILLQRVLLERRKELPFTGQLRWEDLRRLNKDRRFAITLTRVVNGATYTLPPNSPRYVWPIPDYEIQLSGIQQNP